MNQLKILICDENRAVIREYENFLKAKGADTCFCGKNGEKLLETINRYKPDVVITDLFLSHIDGMSVAEDVRKRDFRPALLLSISSVDNENIVSMALNSGFDFFFLKPCSIEMIYDKIMLMLKLEKKDRVAGAVVNVLYDMGTPSHLTGYRYLKTAIELVCENPALINSMISVLYPTVAQINNTTAKRVERSMRTAVELTFIRGNLETLDRLFPYHRKGETKPSNSEFISTIAEHIKSKKLMKTK